MTSRCRSGCATQDHSSYAECARGLQLNAGALLTVQQKNWNSELKQYRNARAEGIQPNGTKMAQIEQAKRISDASGVAYGA
jgi:predicted GNAT family acetyltransferase